MALTGQLSDMSLAELIEFFCNQRKTGRLKVDYHRGHGVFFIKDGELVDAKVGALSGAEAVYFALTLPNAAFDFSGDIEPPRRTITDPWTQVVLEGLRRLDEGTSPTEADAFGGWSPNEADMALFMDHIERLGASDAEDASSHKSASSSKNNSKENNDAVAPLSMMVESTSASGGGKKKTMAIAAVACVVLACGVAAIPLARRFGGNSSAANVQASPTASQPESSSAKVESGAGEAAVASQPEAEAQPASVEPSADAEAAAQAWRREQREREARERARKLEEAKKNELAQKPADATLEAPKPVAPAAVASGPRTVRVSVSYDESGRVTQASVAGTSAGAEAFGGTAVRVARGKRFPAGKAGSTVVTIPIN